MARLMIEILPLDPLRGAWYNPTRMAKLEKGLEHIKPTSLCSIRIGYLAQSVSHMLLT